MGSDVVKWGVEIRSDSGKWQRQVNIGFHFACGGNAGIRSNSHFGAGWV